MTSLLRNARYNQVKTNLGRCKKLAYSPGSSFMREMKVLPYDFKLKITFDRIQKMIFKLLVMTK